jgi:SSS family solute:Na+ symporter
MPFKKKPFTPKQHIWALRLAIVAVGIFGWCFSFFWVQETPIYMFFSITGAIVSGAGPAIIGGLYWKRGGTIAAWVSYIFGATSAVTGIILQQAWPTGLGEWLMNNWNWSWVADFTNVKGQYVFPINGQYVSFFNMVTCTLLYVIISLIEHKMGKPDFNLDKMLHRGIYDTNNEHVEQSNVSKIEKIFGITPEFTIGDKLIYAGSILWTIAWCIVFIVYTSFYFAGKLTDAHWLTLWHVKVYITLILGVGCTVWFLIGGIYDVVGLFKALKNSTVDDSDNGSVSKEA